MSPTPTRDPNAPPDPSELREIPSHQMAPESWGPSHNPVAPGAPPSPEFPTGVPPPELPPEVPTTPPAGPPVNIDVPYAMGPGGDATAVVDETVTVTKGNWQNTPDTYQYLWKRRKGGSVNALPGETSPSYVTTMQDGGQHVFCTVLAKNSIGEAAVDSNEIAVSSAAAAKAQHKKSER